MENNHEARVELQLIRKSDMYRLSLPIQNNMAEYVDKWFFGEGNKPGFANKIHMKPEEIKPDTKPNLYEDDNIRLWLVGFLVKK